MLLRLYFIHVKLLLVCDMILIETSNIKYFGANKLWCQRYRSNIYNFLIALSIHFGSCSCMRSIHINMRGDLMVSMIQGRMNGVSHYPWSIKIWIWMYNSFPKIQVSIPKITPPHPSCLVSPSSPKILGLRSMISLMVWRSRACSFQDIDLGWSHTCVCGYFQKSVVFLNLFFFMILWQFWVKDARLWQLSFL